MEIVRYLSRFLRKILFVLLVLLLLAVAVKNMEQVTLHLMFGQSWRMPLMLLLFLFFVLGVLLTFLACMGRLFRDKREIQSLKRRLTLEGSSPHSGAVADNAAPPPPPDTVL